MICTLQTRYYNGDLHITDKILSGEGVTTEITGEGSVYFDRSVAVKGDVVITADKGDIHVDKNVASVDGTISMSTMEGDIQVGASVATTNGDVSLTTGAGDVSVDNKVSANNGSVTVTISQWQLNQEQ